MANDRFDVIVIGGGINGAAIARECARGGKRVLILEQNDFASGSTSRSTRIIHGGLRYLEHSELGLVRESLRERERLRAECSHLVRPLKFLVAVGAGSQHSALAVRAGLWLYATLGAGRPSSVNGALARLRPALVGLPLRRRPM
jgi:glycerol-3-phosphate dehydrogenase